MSKELTESKKGFIKFIKETIKKSFFEHEKNDFNNGLKMLGLNETSFLLHAIPIDLDNDEPPELIITPETEFLKIIEKKAEGASELDIQILNRFYTIGLRLHFIFLQYIKRDMGVDAALEYVKYLSNNIDIVGNRFLGDHLPDYIIQYRNSLQREIEKLSNQQLENIKTQILIPIQESKTINENESLNKKTVESNYVTSVEILSIVYPKLLESDKPLIEKNPNFIESFCNEIINPSHRTTWLGNQTELFYLLYLLHDEKKGYKDNLIPDLAFKLFTFKRLKKHNLHTFQVNYNKFIKKISSLRYLESKQRRITAIYESLPT